MDWITEPNIMTFTHSGLKCEIKRNFVGSLNIYVYVPENNIFFEIDELDLNAMLKPEREITYSARSGSFWKVGMDFAHINDFNPEEKEDNYPEFMKELEKFCNYQKPTMKDYKNIEYAIEKVKNLAEALSKTKP